MHGPPICFTFFKNTFSINLPSKHSPSTYLTFFNNALSITLPAKHSPPNFSHLLQEHLQYPFSITGSPMYCPPKPLSHLQQYLQISVPNLSHLLQVHLQYHPSVYVLFSKAVISPPGSQARVCYAYDTPAMWDTCLMHAKAFSLRKIFTAGGDYQEGTTETSHALQTKGS
jgi:hypothetical protein